MKVKLVEEQLNNLDGATLQVMYDKQQDSNLLMLTPEKNGESVSIWVDEKLRYTLFEALNTEKLSDLDEILLDVLKEVLQKYGYDFIATIAAAKENIEFMCGWMQSKNQSVIIQKLAIWAEVEEKA
ncbi:TPA_asm: hypothetical protein GYS29_14125 [Listeria monocytogenes]|uniref:hypothetical protein n=1 Tax=Listeria monocytogenes TaxID=1639 RepID=UPI000D72F89C|nr:hypothetical protein [Listeria monocytogenes]PXD73670.1 hypothetical protein C9828_14005 [Listeria monocytogenes]HAB7221627.1 hypothetical protein [Listeria monocytogenes]HAB8294850.1 hypothetical protein [Listeria monocytogenes]HAB8585844.1 hypothetical protein [Listeria monocytogenes]HAB8604021.1 hypothetical protein [Listeria monocytogenes]